MSKRLLASRRLAPLGILALLFGLAVPAFSQEVRATLSGTVTDQSGSAMVGATVHMISHESAATFSAVSNEAGQYHFLYLNPGTYKLTAEMSGFRTFVRDGIELSVGQAATLDIAMQVGTESQSVTVSGTAPLLEAEKADRGLVVDQKNLSQLPVIARVPILMATLAPGVIMAQTSYNIAPFSNGGLSSWSINGSVSPSGGFLLDGAPNDMIYQSTYSMAYIPAVDAVEEFKVVTGAYDAEYGRNGGGVISILMKSGTNTPHGSVYEYMQRPFLDANSFANNASGQPVNYTKLDQYGFTLGGPVWIPKVYHGKDRTFFFVGYEKYRDDTVARNPVSSVPTVAQKAGDFSQTFNNKGQLMPIYDPLTGRSVNGQWVRDVFPGNKIPGNQIDPVGSKIVSLFPDPNFVTPGSVDWQSNYFHDNNITKYFFDNFVVRIDHNFGDKERLYGRYAHNDQLLNDNSNQLPGPAADLRYGDKVNNAGVLDSVTVFNASVALDIRLSLNRWTQNYRPPNWGSNNASIIDWPQSLLSQLPEPNRFPRFTFASYQSLGEGGSNIIYAPSTTVSFSPTLSVSRGRQLIKTGVDIRIMHLANYNSAYAGGTAAFNQGFTRANYLTADSLTGSSIASALLGDAASGEVDYIANPYYRWTYYAPWVQDDIKLTRRLTVNLGLRWDVLSPLTDSQNRLNNGFFTDVVNPISSQIDQTQFPGYKVYGGIGFAGVNGLSRSPFHTDWNNIQPRVGAAYQLTSSTAVRGGFGISYLPQVSTGFSNGFSQTTPYVATVDGGATSAGVISDPFPNGVLPPSGASTGLQTFLGQAPSFEDPDGRIANVYNYSFGFQQVLPGQITLEVAYVGSRTHNVGITKAYNALSLQNLALGDASKGGDPNYLNQKVPNPFAGLLPGTSLNSATITRQQLLLPFPEFTAFNETDIPAGQVWYNSLQISVRKRYSHGFALTASYTLSKNLQALNYLNPEDAAPARSLTQFDRTHVLNIAPIYELPFGPGRAFLSQSNRIVSRLVSGWQLAGNFSYMSGLPMTAPSGVDVIGNPVVPNQSWDQMFNSGLVNANGQVTNAISGLDPAFRIQAPFTLRTVSLYFGNLRDRWGPECNIALAKSTRIRENLSLQIRAEALNAFNHPIFGGNPTIDPTSPNFGKLLRNSGQTNEPRELQLSAKFVF
ncbi:MAG TPA: carboxypeptidase regulatory-like domain-containing protein [Bryobacteraceae bacterium]|nr:carboxypeptidase regulatory-like domain-containing protein [Bryobacteraceae bacterium]